MSPQQSIAHYRITAKLGEGGMGEVYRATDTKLGREVAIKVLPDAFAQDPDRMGRFAREAQVLASLNHPNIAVIHGVEERALVMELVEGPTLAERISQGPIPLQEALPIARQIAEALEYAHERGVVHRDLKPANIKITPEGRVKVLDFGLAKALASDTPSGSSMASPTLTMRATMAGTIIGTAAYMSPEQARGQSVDRRADIWAFGVVLSEMLTGQSLFAGPTISDTLAAVLTRELDLAAVPAEWRPLIERCLRKDPKRRWQSIGDVRVSLEDGPPKALPAAPTPAIHHRSTLPWVVAGALAMVASVAFWMAFRAPRPADRPLMRFSVDLGPDAVAGARVTTALSPDGTRLVFPARNAQGAVQLATRTLDQPKGALLAGTEDASDPFFSPDGQWVGFFSGGRMRKISVQGGGAMTLCAAASPRGASWGDDGNIVFAPTITSGLERAPDSGGPSHPLTQTNSTGEVSHRWPQILPGSQAVLFTGTITAGNYEEANIQVLTVKTGQKKVLQRGGYFGRYVPSGHLIYLHQGTLFAVPFDLARLETRGTAVPIQDEIAANPISGAGQFDISGPSSGPGTLVYLGGKGTGQGLAVTWMDSTGKTLPLLSAPKLYLTPRFSPDGRRLAVSMTSGPSGDIWVYDLQRDSMTQLTFNSRIGRSPAWTPDGKHIALSAVGSKGIYEIWWVRSDGAGEPQVLLESKGGTIYPSSFSPDGKRLAYTDSGQGGFDIRVIPLDLTDPDHPKPGPPEAFLATPAAESEPAFSPDGRWIAYSSDEAGSSEIYVRPYRAGGSAPGGRWRISSTGGRAAMWSRDGRRLFYLAGDSRVMVADCTPKGDSFDAGRPIRWSERPVADPIQGPLRMLDLSADGKRFAITEFSSPTVGAQGSIHVNFLLNFFDDLRRRVPVK